MLSKFIETVAGQYGFVHAFPLEHLNFTAFDEALKRERDGKAPEEGARQDKISHMEEAVEKYMIDQQQEASKLWTPVLKSWKWVGHKPFKELSHLHAKTHLDMHSSATARVEATVFGRSASCTKDPRTRRLGTSFSKAI